MRDLVSRVVWLCPGEGVWGSCIGRDFAGGRCCWRFCQCCCWLLPSSWIQVSLLTRLRLHLLTIRWCRSRWALSRRGAVDLGVGGPTVPTTAPIAIPTTAPVLMPEEPSVPDPLASIADLHDEVLLSQDTLLYRVYGGEAGPIGGYWSRTAPSGPMQAQMDSALNPAWGNLATDVSTIRVPAGTTIYEGAAAAQPLTGGGSLLGGGNQVFIPRVDSAWLVGG